MTGPDAAETEDMPPLRPVARALAWAAAAVVVALPLASPGGPLAFAFAASYDPPLTISGSIDGLQPGEPSSLVLTVTNPTGHGMVIGTLSARVAGASAGCAAAALSITSWHGRLEVPAHGAATARLAVRLSPDAPACAGATWQLAYTSS